MCVCLCACVSVGDNAEDHVIEMTGATKCVSYYGIADLNEILSAIQLNNTCDLTTSRSVKVRHYFQVVHLLVACSCLHCSYISVAVFE